jgi:hypothetical protein
MFSVLDQPTQQVPAGKPGGSSDQNHRRAVPRAICALCFFRLARLLRGVLAGSS